MTAYWLEIDEILNSSIMTGVPSLIVEGVDDIKIYDKLALRAEQEVEIYAVEQIKGFSEGCEEVIRAIEELDLLPMKNSRLNKHILGIIDADVRKFRGPVPQSAALFILNYYSIETHFVSSESLMESIKGFCMIPENAVTNTMCGSLVEDIHKKLTGLYYPSLDALRGAIDPNYHACIGYNLEFGRIWNDPNLKLEIERRKTDLDVFAKSIGLNCELEDIKIIAKGKWVKEFFVREVITLLKQLQAHCKNQKIEPCRSCAATLVNKCLYRVKNGVDYWALKQYLLNACPGNEFQYIVDRIGTIKN